VNKEARIKKEVCEQQATVICQRYRRRYLFGPFLSLMKGEKT
jgi:hypothetical protein